MITLIPVQIWAIIIPTEINKGINIHFLMETFASVSWQSAIVALISAICESTSVLSSIFSKTALASSSLPFKSNHLGDSERNAYIASKMTAGTAPARNIALQFSVNENINPIK